MYGTRVENAKEHIRELFQRFKEVKAEAPRSLGREAPMIPCALPPLPLPPWIVEIPLSEATPPLMTSWCNVCLGPHETNACPNVGVMQAIGGRQWYGVRGPMMRCLRCSQDVCAMGTPETTIATVLDHSRGHHSGQAECTLCFGPHDYVECPIENRNLYIAHGAALRCHVCSIDVCHRGIPHNTVVDAARHAATPYHTKAIALGFQHQWRCFCHHLNKCWDTRCAMCGSAKEILNPPGPLMFALKGTVLHISFFRGDTPDASLHSLISGLGRYAFLLRTSSHLVVGFESLLSPDQVSSITRHRRALVRGCEFAYVAGGPERVCTLCQGSHSTCWCPILELDTDGNMIFARSGVMIKCLACRIHIGAVTDPTSTIHLARVHACTSDHHEAMKEHNIVRFLHAIVVAKQVKKKKIGKKGSQGSAGTPGEETRTRVGGSLSSYRAFTIAASKKKVSRGAKTRYFRATTGPPSTLEVIDVDAPVTVTVPEKPTGVIWHVKDSDSGHVVEKTSLSNVISIAEELRLPAPPSFPIHAASTIRITDNSFLRNQRKVSDISDDALREALTPFGQFIVRRKDDHIDVAFESPTQASECVLGMAHALIGSKKVKVVMAPKPRTTPTTVVNNVTLVVPPIPSVCTTRFVPTKSGSILFHGK